MTIRDLFLERNDLVFWMLGTWLAAVVWMVWAIGAMIEGKLSAPLGMIVMLIAGGVAGVTTFYTDWTAYTAPLALLVSITIPVMARQLNTREHAILDAERMQRAAGDVLRMPTNAAARARLATLCHEADLLSSAVAHLSEALRLAPQAFTNEKITLRSWTRDLDALGGPRDILCPNCRAYNPPDALNCSRCRQAILYLIVARNWLPQGMATQLAKTWGIAVLVVGLAWGFNLVLPAEVAIALQVAVIGIGLFLFMRTLRQN